MIGGGDVPVLPRGVRVHRCEVRQAWLLLAPERAVKLDQVGAAILQALLRVWPTDRLSVADRGLREGLLYAQMSADGVLEDGLY